jgi:hypothetical protein
LVLLRGVLAALALVLALVAEASAAEEVVALDYRAPAICPNAAEFQAQIQGFVPGISVQSELGTARRFEIAVDESGRFGELRVFTEQGQSSRTAHGADCAEVARLLAFAVALVLDPQLVLEEPVASAPNQSSDASSLEPELMPRPLPALVVPSAASVENPAPTRARRATQSLAATGALATALSPSPSYGVGALYGLSPTWGSLRPLLRLGASYFTSADASRDGATVAFFSVLGAVEACPAAFATNAVELWPCLRVDLGARSAAGADIPRAKTRLRPWLTFDAMLYARLRVAPPLFLELGGGAMFPAWHDRVFLEPDTTVHRVPLVGFLGQIALGVELGDRNRN